MRINNEDFKEPIEDIQEDIEKHDELNPLLFENNKVKPEIKLKALEIADELLRIMSESGLEIKLKDVVLTGSNASYNYTKDSDVDIHLVADMTDIDDPNEMYPILFNSFKSAFNKKYEISFYNIPVEVYIESSDTPVVSNGIYSLREDDWIKEPKNDAIPEFDESSFDKALAPWVSRYKKLISDIKYKKITEETPIDDYINDLYKLRTKGLSKDGEYSTENLVFKEIRNLGYLDNLKTLRDKVVETRLSLEEQLCDQKYLRELQIKIQQLTHHQPMIQPNGLFEIYDIPENESHFVLNLLRRQNFIECVQMSANKFDFSRFSYTGLPAQKYRIYGKLK